MKQYPKIKFIYSYPYSVNLFRILGKGEADFRKLWEETELLGSAFENYLKPYQSKILELIPKYSGYDWSEFAEPIIFVYPVYPYLKIPSFSHPLTLKVRKDNELTLGIFIHELAHNNMNFSFHSLELMEQVMATITIEVMRALSLSVESYQNFAIDIFEKRFRNKSAFLPELKDKTVKEHLKELTQK